jgi:hypothetical protein
MEYLRIGPEGLLLVHGLMISALLAFLSWRGVSLGRAGTATMLVALAIVAWQYWAFRDEVNHPMLTMLFVVVPSAILLGASRANWLARRAWVLLLLGPIAFVVCYVGICECAFFVMRAFA